MGDTIYALASAAGKAGVSVVRISGPQSFDVLKDMIGTVPAARQASLRNLRSRDGTVLDQALVLVFENGHSFTGEDVVELHLHGSIAVLRAVMGEIETGGRARLAEPGEFTRRALMNERLDLAEVQGLADMIDAETEVQRREAMRVMSGEMSDRILDWRQRLIRAMALLEATIDFADEEVPENVWPEVLDILGSLHKEWSRELAGVRSAQSLRNGFEVALVGKPNAGKSSLLNHLSRREVAIVSDIPGTTRDVIENRIEINGLIVNFLDMAGLRDGSDQIEKIGIDRARDRLGRADLRLFLHEEADEPCWTVTRQPDDLVYRTKSDRNGGHGISAIDGNGIEELLDSVYRVLSERVTEAGFISRDRDAKALSDALEEIAPVLDGALRDEELAAENLRIAARRLSSILGLVDVENVLDEVFSSFCLGK